MSTLIEYDSILQYYIVISTIISVLIYVLSDNAIVSVALGYMPITAILSIFLDAYPNINPNIWYLIIRGIIVGDVILLIFSISKTIGLVFVSINE